MFCLKSLKVLKNFFSTLPKSINKLDNSSLFRDHTIIFEEDASKLILDYTKSVTVVKFSDNSDSSLFPFISNTGFLINNAREFQLKENPLALQILSEGIINLSDNRINIIDAKLDLQDLFSDKENKIMQINIGEIGVINQESIHIEDIDVFNVPEDKEIILNSNKKQMILLGRKVIKNVSENMNTSLNKNEFSVSKNIFEENTFEEIKQIHLFKFEAIMVKFNYRELLRVFIKYLPFWILFFCFSTTVRELYRAKITVNLMEEQEMQIFNLMRDKYKKEILTSNPLFKRIKN